MATGRGLGHTHFAKKAKRGKMLQVSREHYLRKDIPCGSPLAPPERRGESDVLSGEDGATYLIPDAETALTELDLLADPSVKDVILLSSVLEEAKKRSQGAHTRLRGLEGEQGKRCYVFANEHHRETHVNALEGEQPDERNTRAVRVAAEWYRRIVPRARIVLLSNSESVREKAREDGLETLSAVEYASERKGDAPHLLELCSGAESKESAMSSGGPFAERGASKKRKVFEEHWPMSEVNTALREGRVYQGVMRVSKSNCFCGFAKCEGIPEGEIAVRGKLNMNRAMDGDVVAVVPFPRGANNATSAQTHISRMKRPGEREVEHGDDEDEVDEEEAPGVAPPQMEGEGDEGAATEPDTVASEAVAGRVVGIVRRGWRTRGYCGALEVPRSREYEDGKAQKALVVPIEAKYPKIAIVTRQAATLADKRIVVAIDGWDSSSSHPWGHYVRTVGQVGDKEAETEVALHEADIEHRPFPESVYACLPPVPFHISDSEREKRMDLRDFHVLSVDPPGSKDLDDALHCRALPNGNVEVGVHIADVSHFMKPETSLDNEASRRATSTYLTHKSAIWPITIANGD